MLKTTRTLFSEVAIARTDGELESTLRSCIDMVGGLARYIKKTYTVFIKPNLTAGAPAESGGTTGVGIVEAVVKLVKEVGPARIIVGEGAGNEIRTAEAFQRLGYFDMARRTNVELVDCDNVEYVDVHLKDALYRETVHLPRIFLESDVFINVPALKTHVACGITVALKNTFGLIPDTDKTEVHRDGALEECLVDINRIKPADLVIVDGRTGAEGVAGGTDFDHPIHANIIIVGNDPVAVDTVCTRVMKQNPRIRYLRWAAQRGIGTDALDYILIKGLNIRDAECPFMTPAQQLMKDSGGKLRLFDLESCSGCRSIAEGGVYRFARPNVLLESVDIVYGPGPWDMPVTVNPRTVLLGDCVREEYRSRGIWIGGCPPSGRRYYEILDSFDVVCRKCIDLANRVINSVRDDLSSIRVLAGGREILRGSKNLARMDDYLLAVGDCQQGYCRHHSHRVRKMTEKNPEDLIEFVSGCPPTIDEIIAGLNALSRRAIQLDKQTV